MVLTEGLNSLKKKVSLYATRAYGIKGGGISFTDH